MNYGAKYPGIDKLQLGDTLVLPLCFQPGLRKEGTVVYIHPEGRFYTLEFTFPGGLDGKPRKFRESYWTMPEGAAAEDPGLGGRPPGHYKQTGALGKYLANL